MMFGFRFRVNLSMDMSSNDMSSKDDKKVNDGGEGVKYNLNSPAVTTHLSITAEIINRLANNSNYCKSACVAVVAVFAALTTNPQCSDSNLIWWRVLVWGLPVLSLWILDSLFVYLKKSITTQQDQFVKDITSGRDVKPFVLKPTENKVRGIFFNMGDISTIIFYFIMIASLVLDIWLRSRG